MKKIFVAVAAALLLLSQAFTSFADVSATGAVEGGTLIMSTEYPSRAVSAGDRPDFTIDFENKGESQLVKLYADSVPEGWTVDFLGDGNSVGSVFVKNGSTSNAYTLRIQVPEDRKSVV